jgi:hypothetical protein
MFKQNCIFVAASLMTVIATISVLLNLMIGGSITLGGLVLASALSLAYMARRDRSTRFDSTTLGA